MNGNMTVTYNGQVIAALIVRAIVERRFLTHDVKHIRFAWNIEYTQIQLWSRPKRKRIFVQSNWMYWQ